ncbi:hypothetical protein [Azospirillum sp. 11R-A]|uniref:hypothetical protein n=1 Tax=Azospirillum sp. 11R-A TaxID=3111634 RepID=UPI003C2E2E3F
MISFVSRGQGADVLPISPLQRKMNAPLSGCRPDLRQLGTGGDRQLRCASQRQAGRQNAIVEQLRGPFGAQRCAQGIEDDLRRHPAGSAERLRDQWSRRNFYSIPCYGDCSFCMENRNHPERRHSSKVPKKEIRTPIKKRGKWAEAIVLPQPSPVLIRTLRTKRHLISIHIHMNILLLTWVAYYEIQEYFCHHITIARDFIDRFSLLNRRESFVPNEICKVINIFRKTEEMFVRFFKHQLVANECTFQKSVHIIQILLPFII